MFAAILTAACLAPVPAHLTRPEADPIVPGFRWMYLSGDRGYDLEVVRVNGDEIVFRCVNVPSMQWRPYSDSPEGAKWSIQTRSMVLSEWKRYGAPLLRYKPIESPEW